ncbi:hypothetical protein BK004_00940 [bacterium CG10_46_32]|nr:MAG: hypothetical protein BK004_00940 [bacterium CG10_46_32]PIR56458.1 MAG: hypothetical protein COU73_00950 [Parcubacteria group bacterium CG10_big_fil_rev_8_21_14_0_10_46_32]
MNSDTCSVVVCTRNRLPHLKACLSSLAAQTFSKHEIIVVNDGSTDGTREFLDSLNQETITVVHNNQTAGKSAARNKGIQHAHAGIIAFIDDDCTADPRWLAELLAGFTSERCGMVIGQTFYISKTYHGYFPERLVANPNAHWPMTCNIAYQKTVFQTCGGFNTVFDAYNNEDSEMAIRTRAAGFSFNRAPDAIVFHQPAVWTQKSLLASAKNASVWPVLKKKYPNHYACFGPPIMWGTVVNATDYLYLLASPILIPLLLARYLAHGKRNVKIFFTKWPLLLLLRRYYVYREALARRILML